MTLLQAIDDAEVNAVAFAIAKVIAKKTIAEDPRLRKMDALGRASAATTMANNMVPMLVEESRAAIDAIHLMQPGAA